MSGRRIATTALGISLASLVLLEATLGVWLAVPWLPAPTLVQHLADSESLYPQWDPACARYDAEYSYVLVPGSCRFRTREFDSEIHINRSGFRDDEQSLHAPPIIAVGDSHTFGWGLDQGEAFPEALEGLLGVRVLNTGVPSYATYREMRRLDTLDTSGLTHLIVQYDTNDYVENKTFLKNGSVTAMDPGWYQSLREGRLDQIPYWPGKYAWFALRFAFLEPRRVPNVSTEVKAFLNAIERASSADLSGVRILVMATGPGHQRFLGELDNALAAPERPEWMNRLEIVDLEDEMTRDAYFRLDPHMHAAAHARIAARLAEVIRSSMRHGESR